MYIDILQIISDNFVRHGKGILAPSQPHPPHFYFVKKLTLCGSILTGYYPNSALQNLSVKVEG